MSICFLSLETNKVFNELILEKLVEEGFTGLSTSLVVIFPYLNEYENISISNLAKVLGYSRQAMHKNLKKLESLDYISINSSNNKKEKVVMMTEKSERVMTIAGQFIKSIESEISDKIGSDELALYIQSQQKIHSLLMSKVIND